MSLALPLSRTAQTALPTWTDASSSLHEAPDRRPVPALACARGELALDLHLRHAGRRKLRVGWQRLGDAGLPAVVVQGGISADRRAAGVGGEAPGWWQAQVGRACAIDPERTQVISIDWLGSDGTLDAPIDSADQADALAAVLDHLGVERLQAFVGCSYGAQVGLQFAARHGSRLHRLLAIAGAHRPHPYACALRAIQRKIVALGQLQCADSLGLSLARQLAMLSYRPPEEFARRFAGPARLDGAHARCAAEDYLHACGERFVRSHAPNAFVRLSESIDLHALAPAAITVPTTVVAVEGDLLAPPELAFELAERATASVRVRVLRSAHGHDAFLTDVAPIAAIVREVLEESGCAPAPAGAP